MALFWSKKPKAEKNYEQEAQGVSSATKVKKAPGAKKATAPKAAKATKAVAAVSTGEFRNESAAVLKPHITEKSGVLSQNGVYTFVISSGANKNTVAKAVKTLYKVTPVRVAIVNLPAKNVFVKGRRGVVSGTRKALVTVKKGDKIDFV